MEFSATPTDLIKVAELAHSIDANPLALAGRFLGLSGSETDAGIPKWAWIAAACGAGLYVGIQYGPAIREKLGFR